MTQILSQRLYVPSVLVIQYGGMLCVRDKTELLRQEHLKTDLWKCFGISYGSFLPRRQWKIYIMNYTINVIYYIKHCYFEISLLSLIISRFYSIDYYAYNYIYCALNYNN